MLQEKDRKAITGGNEMSTYEQRVDICNAELAATELNRVAEYRSLRARVAQQAQGCLKGEQHLWENLLPFAILFMQDRTCLVENPFPVSAEQAARLTPKDWGQAWEFHQISEIGGFSSWYEAWHAFGHQMLRNAKAVDECRIKSFRETLEEVKGKEGWCVVLISPEIDAYGNHAGRFTNPTLVIPMDTPPSRMVQTSLSVQGVRVLELIDGSLSHVNVVGFVTYPCEVCTWLSDIWSR